MLGWGGVGGCNYVHVCCLTCDATLMLRSCLGGVGWGGVGHTGAIDSVWRLVKQQVPGSLSSTVKGSKAFPGLMVYARQWQWRFVQKKQPFWGNRQTIVCWPLQMTTAKGKRNFIWHHATSRCANETTWKRGKNHMFQERTNINQWIYEQDVDVISHVPAHRKCTWKPFLRSDNPLVRFMDVYGRYNMI